MLPWLLYKAFPEASRVLALLAGINRAVAANSLRIDRVHGDVRSILETERRNLQMNQDVRALLQRIDTATNQIAERLRKLLNNVQPGMSQEEVTALKEELTARAVELEAMGKDPENPTGGGETSQEG